MICHCSSLSFVSPRLGCCYIQKAVSLSDLHVVDFHVVLPQDFVCSCEGKLLLCFPLARLYSRTKEAGANPDYSRSRNSSITTSLLAIDTLSISSLTRATLWDRPIALEDVSEALQKDLCEKRTLSCGW